MRAIILAAGEGKRMAPLTLTRPKALVELAGAPLIDHVVRSAREGGATSVAVVVGVQSEALVAHLERSPLGPFEIVKQERPRGTGDAVRAASSLLDEEALIVNGDVLASAGDIAALRTSQARGAAVTMLTAEVADASRYGVVEFEGGGNGPCKVTALSEKPERPATRHVNAGVYKAGAELAAAVERVRASPRGEYELTSAVEALVREGRAFALPAKRPWTEVGRPWDLLVAQERLMAGWRSEHHGEVEPGAVLKGAVVVSKGALVKSGSYIEGPVFIGPDARVGPHCYIRGATHIGASCHIGASTEVKNSILFAHTNAPHLNYIGDSVLGSHVNLGAGTVTANLRLDEREVFANVGGVRVRTGLRKLGAVLGDGVKTGINASIDVGTFVGPGAFIGPGARASGSIEAGARVM